MRRAITKPLKPNLTWPLPEHVRQLVDQIAEAVLRDAGDPGEHLLALQARVAEPGIIVQFAELHAQLRRLRPDYDGSEIDAVWLVGVAVGRRLARPRAAATDSRH